MKELVEALASALVDYLEEVQVKDVEGTEAIVFELRTHPEDLGRFTRRAGRIVSAIRAILGAAGMKHNKRFRLEVVEIQNAATNSS